MKFNYAIIILGSVRIEGHVDRYEIGNQMIDVHINGNWYKISKNNIVFMERD